MDDIKGEGILSSILEFDTAIGESKENYDEIISSFLLENNSEESIVIPSGGEYKKEHMKESRMFFEEEEKEYTNKEVNEDLNVNENAIASLEPMKMSGEEKDNHMKESNVYVENEVGQENMLEEVTEEEEVSEEDRKEDCTKELNVVVKGDKDEHAVGKKEEDREKMVKNKKQVISNSMKKVGKPTRMGKRGKRNNVANGEEVNKEENENGEYRMEGQTNTLDSVVKGDEDKEHMETNINGEVTKKENTEEKVKDDKQVKTNSQNKRGTLITRGKGDKKNKIGSEGEVIEEDQKAGYANEMDMAGKEGKAHTDGEVNKEVKKEESTKEKVRGGKQKPNSEKKVEKLKRKGKGGKKNKITWRGMNEVIAKNTNVGTLDERAEKKTKSMGMIFLCNSKTKQDCFHYKVLGLPANKRDIVLKIYEGMNLFLFDYDLKLLYGIFKAAGPGGYNIEPKAFGSAFPSQVRFNVFDDCLPLPEEKFKKIIKDNYYQKHKFDCELNSGQVKNLSKLFQAFSRAFKSKSKQRHRIPVAETSTSKIRERTRKRPPRAEHHVLGERESTVKRHPRTKASAVEEQESSRKRHPRAETFIFEDQERSWKRHREQERHHNSGRNQLYAEGHDADEREAAVSPPPSIALPCSPYTLGRTLEMNVYRRDPHIEDEDRHFPDFKSKSKQLHRIPVMETSTSKIRDRTRTRPPRAEHHVLGKRENTGKRRPRANASAFKEQESTKKYRSRAETFTFEDQERSWKPHQEQERHHNSGRNQLYAEVHDAYEREAFAAAVSPPPSILLPRSPYAQGRTLEMNVYRRDPLIEDQDRRFLDLELRLREQIDPQRGALHDYRGQYSDLEQRRREGIEDHDPYVLNGSRPLYHYRYYSAARPSEYQVGGRSVHLAAPPVEYRPYRPEYRF